MITLNIGIPWPWAKDYKQAFHNYFVRERHFFGHKNYCIQISKSQFYDLIRLSINLSFRGRDHAGPSFALDLGRYTFEASIYDTRHWDYKKGTWDDGVDDADYGV